MSIETFDVVVVGGGPAGATVAAELAGAGWRTLLLDRAGRIKPCGGAVPPQLMTDFDVPESLLVARINCARMVSPRGRQVDIPVGDGFVGMVDRGVFDEWLRERAAHNGAERRVGNFTAIDRDTDDTALVRYVEGKGRGTGVDRVVRARIVVGADGALSQVARQAIPKAKDVKHVFAYHELVRSPAQGEHDFDAGRCDVWYQGPLSPDFYAWIFPHGELTSVGTGSMQKGFALREAVAKLREQTGLADAETVRREGAPIPLEPLRRWDNGRDVIVAGDAAGVVAPASGEGIFYAMTCGRLVAEAVALTLATGDARMLRHARARFMSKHGQVFRMLGVMQRFWYANDNRRERFVAICRDVDVQRLTFEAYMRKELVRAKPMAHLKIFFKNLAHLAGLVPA